MKLIHTLLMGFVALQPIAAQQTAPQLPATTTHRHQKWELGLQAGAIQGQNDINDFGINDLNVSGGALIRYHLDDNFALRANVLYGEITANDANYSKHVARGYTFSSPLTEGSLVFEVDLLGKYRYRDNGKFRRLIAPYAFAGAGYAFTQPETFYNETANTEIRDLIDIDKSKKSTGHLALPLGLGVKIDLTEEWVFGIESSLRVTFNDYFDGISQSGNPLKNDTYALAGASISYRIPYERDSDHDGISDSEDACPTEKGDRTNKGCPDTDSDGIIDKIDGCPTEKGSRETNGCPDTDGDGIGDKNDACPTEKGPKNTGGCPDTDRDGIADKSDQCPDIAGISQFLGCPDTDGDGIMDKDDQCPDQKGSADRKGCPLNDRDRDGVLDEQDACPDEAGKASLSGCPDADNDGVANAKDRCPDVAGTVASMGCPELSAADKKVLADAIYGVQFESAKSVIKTNSYTILDQVASVMNRYPAYNLTISGHTDSAGNDASNQRLSEARAKASFDYLVSKGIAAARMTHRGFGETKPVADNTTADGKAKNRRVEFELNISK